MKMTIRKKFHNTSLGPPNPRFMQEKVKKKEFAKKALTRIAKLL
jgi:hypothetical protein